MENLQVGTFGWQYDSWVGGFYPEDIPEDWLLDYYGNAYRVVLVPEELWLEWEEEDIEEALEAVEGAFSFYFEVKDEITSQKEMQLQKIVEILEEKAGGVIVAAEEGRVPTSFAGLPVTLVSKSQVLPGWQWQYDDLVCSGAVCGVVKGTGLDAKQQTEMLQGFMQSLPEGQSGAPMLIYSDEIDMKQVYSLKTIGEFLGY